MNTNNSSFRSTLLDVIIIFLTLTYLSYSITIINEQITKKVHKDFSSYYFSAIALARGVDLFDISALQDMATSMGYSRTFTETVYIYPPFLLLIVLPLTFFKYSTALMIWMVVNQFLLIGVMWLYYNSSGKTSFHEFKVHLLILLLFLISLSYSIYCGQITILILFLMMMFYYAVKRKMFSLAGISLAASTMIKPIAIIFYPYLFFKKQWGTLVTALTTIAILLLFTVFSVGFDINAKFIYITLMNSLLLPSMLESILNINQFTMTSIKVMVGIMFLALLYLLCRQDRTNNKKSFELEYIFIIASTLALLPRNAYYNYILLAPSFWILYDNKDKFLRDNKIRYLMFIVFILIISPEFYISFYGILFFWLLMLYLMFKRQ